MQPDDVADFDHVDALRVGDDLASAVESAGAEGEEPPAGQVLGVARKLWQARRLPSAGRDPDVYAVQGLGVGSR